MKIHGQQVTPNQSLQGQTIKPEPAYELLEEPTLYESDVRSNRNEPDQGISRNFPNNS